MKEITPRDVIVADKAQIEKKKKNESCQRNKSRYIKGNNNKISMTTDSSSETVDARDNGIASLKG